MLAKGEQIVAIRLGARAAFREREGYRTRLGHAYVADSLEMLRLLPDCSINAIVTSPPFALRTPKKYGNLPEDRYIEWFLDFAREFQRVLRDDGSLVVEIGGAWMKGKPARSIYQFKLLVQLVDEIGLYLAQDFYWVNRAKLPGPAQWVTVNRIRAKDAVTPIWWLSKTPYPKSDNRRVLKPYSPSMQRLFVNGYNDGLRPSGHNISGNFAADNGGAIPSNLIETSNTRSADDYQVFCRENGLVIHPARFPREVPDFFIKFLTDPGDLVLDPFAGSNMTGAVAEDLGRRWVSIDSSAEYVEGSIGRFSGAVLSKDKTLTS